MIAAWYSRITLPHKKRVGAAVWLLAALGLGLWQAHAGPRYNAATDLRAIVGLTQRREKTAIVDEAFAHGDRANHVVFTAIIDERRQIAIARPAAGLP